MIPRAREVEQSLAEVGALPPDAGIVVAVSGGRDSMLLLRFLAALAPKHRWRLSVAHLNHRLRGADADADARFVRESARDLGLPVQIGRVDVRRSRRRGESLEEAARRCRHTFLAATARRLASPWIATGHHAEDQLELFLLRLLRGTGPAAFGGMNPVDPSPADPAIQLVRPLLPFESDWLDAAARDLNLAFRQDATNQDTAFLRNRVRHELLPLLRTRFQPALGRVLRRAQTLVRDQASVITDQSRAWLAATPPRSPEFAQLPIALQREVLRLQLLGAAVPPEFELLETLRINSDRLVQIDARRRVRRMDHGAVEVLAASPGEHGGGFSRDEATLDLATASGSLRFGGLRVHWRLTSAGALAARPSRPDTEFLDAERLGTPLRLRHWRPGDRFQPLGLSAAAKLQNLFVNAKIPAAERRRRVVAETSTGTLFWVEGLRLGEAARLGPETRQVLVWRWRREPPPRSRAAPHDSPQRG